MKRLLIILVGSLVICLIALPSLASAQIMSTEQLNLYKSMDYVNYFDIHEYQLNAAVGGAGGGGAGGDPGGGGIDTGPPGSSNYTGDAQAVLSAFKQSSFYTETNCVMMTWFFIKTYTKLVMGDGNGDQVAATTAKANSLPLLTTPVAPAVFSAHGTFTGKNPCCAEQPAGENSWSHRGHTGIVVSVVPQADGSAKVTVLESYPARIYTRTWTPAMRDRIFFVSLAGHLN